MNIPQEHEVLAAVETINSEIAGVFLEEAEKDHDVWDDVTALQLEFSSNGLACSVDFMGSGLWSSENEGTPYGQDGAQLPWVPYFKSLMATRLNRASQLKQRLF